MDYGFNSLSILAAAGYVIGLSLLADGVPLMGVMGASVSEIPIGREMKVKP